VTSHTLTELSLSDVHSQTHTHTHQAVTWCSNMYLNLESKQRLSVLFHICMQYRCKGIFFIYDFL